MLFASDFSKYLKKLSLNLLWTFRVSFYICFKATLKICLQWCSQPLLFPDSFLKPLFFWNSKIKLTSAKAIRTMRCYTTPTEMKVFGSYVQFYCYLQQFDQKNIIIYKRGHFCSVTLVFLTVATLICNFQKLLLISSQQFFSRFGKFHCH